MKIWDLFKKKPSSEWDNNKRPSLDDLNKAQLSASHHFDLELNRLYNKYPDDSSLRYLMGCQTRNHWDSQTAMAFQDMSSETHPSLKAKFDRMLKAKKAYEKAGGQLEYGGD